MPRSLRLAAALSLLALPGAAQAQGAGTGLDVRFESLRNSRGTLRICLNRNPNHYPDCASDPQARKVNLPASSRSVRFDNLPQGTYALTAIHDENSDGKLNSFLGIPREGFAFSNNPTVRFGPPSYNNVRFSLGPARGAMSVRFRYIM